MKLSMLLMGTRNGSYTDIVDQIVEAESLGFTGAWLAERYFANGDLLWPSPMVAAAYIAANTKRIRLGLAARVLSFHHPLHVASDAATLDILSGGRLDLGLSRGSMDEAPHQAFAVPRDESRQRFDEALEILKLTFRNQSFSFRGRYFDLNNIVPSPGFVQQPYPPLYLVANNPMSLDAAAEQGHNVFMNGALRLAELGQTFDRYRHRRAAAGFDPENADVPVNRFIFVGEDRQHARRIMREPFLQFIQSRAPDLKAYLTGKFGERALSFDFLAEEIAIFDDPEGCAARLGELYDKVGLRHALCTFNLITLDHRSCVESMRRFAKEVVPRLAWRNDGSFGSSDAKISVTGASV